MRNLTIDTDRDGATITVTSDFDAPIDRVWQLWADPRKLERWWGPPGYPATVTEHDLRPGGRVLYYMTSPDNQRYYGLWNVFTVDAPTGLEVEDAFADENGNVSTELPSPKMQVSLSETEGGTRMVIHSVYPSTEAMEKVLEMGVVEGLKAAMSQIDPILEEMAAA